MQVLMGFGYYSPPELMCTKSNGNTPVDFNSAGVAPGSLYGINSYASPLIPEEMPAKKYRFTAS